MEEELIVLKHEVEKNPTKKRLEEINIDLNAKVIKIILINRRY